LRRARKSAGPFSFAVESTAIREDQRTRSRTGEAKKTMVVEKEEEEEEEERKKEIKKKTREREEKIVWSQAG